jgi:plasmid maintenance system antidote protein VapI
MSAGKQPSPISDMLRLTIVRSGVPYLTLEQKTGVQRGSIGRFVRGSQSLRLDKADRLAAYFGLELRAKNDHQKRG